MTSSEIINKRLQNHHLVGTKFSFPEEVVNWLGAVQAQDFPAAKWSLGMRLKNSSDQEIEKAFNGGKFLRTHTMRPTWHFVMPEDLVWMQKLTSHRVKSLLNHYNRKLELDDKLFSKTNILIVKVLEKEKFLTRADFKILLEKIGIKTDVQRLAHIVMWAELDALICSGPKIGKNLTYALVEERVPKTKELTFEESLEKLAMRYFESHGPAQVKDFSWWSGLTMKESRVAVELIKTKLAQEIVNGKTYLFVPEKFEKIAAVPAFIMSVFDEYTIAYKDRSDLSKENFMTQILSMGSAFDATVVIDGAVVGAWKRKLIKDSLQVSISPFRKFNKIEIQELEIASEKLGKFLGLQVILRIN